MTSKADGAREGGFSLLEVMLCVGILVAGSIAALGVVPALVRGSQQDLVRSAATEIGRNALERVRAAVAYYPAPAGIGDVRTTSDHAWAFDPSGSATYVAAVHVAHPFCGSKKPVSDVPMTVTIAYDTPNDTVRVAVMYPLDACAATVLGTVSLTTTLAASQWSPQTQLAQPINEPALQ